jgi:hypothetical protein
MLAQVRTLETASVRRLVRNGPSSASSTSFRSPRRTTSRRGLLKVEAATAGKVEGRPHWLHPPLATACLSG